MNIIEMMKNFKDLQGDLAKIETTGRTGADMVIATINGTFQLTRLSISDEALSTHDSTVISELVQAAVNDAAEKMRQAIQQKMGGSGVASLLGGMFNNDNTPPPSSSSS